MIKNKLSCCRKTAYCFLLVWMLISIIALSSCSSVSPSIPTVGAASSTFIPTMTDAANVTVLPSSTSIASSSYPSTATPESCTSKGTIDRIDVLNIDPPIGTTMKIGETYYLRVQVQFQLVTWPQAYLQLLLYQFNNGTEEHA